jgi:predicted  nucleic acid-binding Zn-ribbon protein
MSAPVAILREIHRLRRHAKALQERIEHGPRQLRAQQAAFARQEEELRQTQEGLKGLKMTTHQREGALKDKQQQLKKYQLQRQQAVSTKKEYDALTVEIDNANREIQRLEDEILDMMADAEERAAKLPLQEKALQQAKADLQRFEQENAARTTALAEERQKTLRHLGEAETQLSAALPEEQREKYVRISKAKGEDALSAVEGRTCTACYTEVTAQQYNDLVQGAFMMCTSCGRILYLPEA